MEIDQFVRDFSDELIDAFSTYSCNRVAQKFVTPCLMVGEAGESQVFHSFPEISRYLQAYLDDYEAKGCKRCHYTNFVVSWFKITKILACTIPKFSEY
ncbi:MAG TPA: hypothetical protein DEF79_12180 [Gammaproteobacteria bacterium]|jgi:predicted nucleic-acid-binding Zn-ribbon protein|nr:hypothetical protein [Gammaproteobacteria bacterium]|tara:strand:- start:19691 stop:19984 length:294 start_codon:yes stop_codon:yes gene_type:complete